MADGSWHKLSHSACAISHQPSAIFPASQLHPRWLERGIENRRTDMLETIAVILIVLWLLGVVSGYTLGNFIYVLLVIAIVLFLVRVVSGRRVV
jgi:hypothetical protein